MTHRSVYGLGQCTAFDIPDFAEPCLAIPTFAEPCLAIPTFAEPLVAFPLTAIMGARTLTVLQAAVR